MPAEELAIVKQVRTFMETKIALIITKYWVEDAFPVEILPALKELNIGGVAMQVVAAVADGLTEPTKERSNSSSIWRKQGQDYMDNNILTEKELSNSAYSHIIHVPIEKVDIAAVWRWGMRIGNAEMLAPLEAGSSRLRVLT
jgi:hypothetical protein